MRIFLTGFMGSGKSFTGRQLAQIIGRPFVDLDHWIENQQDATITDLFNREGEDHFRRLEAAALRDLEQMDYFVLATGGGTPCYHDNMDWMNERGITVFIDPPVEVLLQRLEGSGGVRPLLADEPDLLTCITERLETRRPIYEKAKFHLKPKDPNANVARLIAEILPR